MSIKSRLEDIFFSVIQHLPIVPGFLMNWTNDYLNRRITQLQHETIRQQWDKASLEKTLSEIHERAAAPQRESPRTATGQRKALTENSIFPVSACYYLSL